MFKTIEGTTLLFAPIHRKPMINHLFMQLEKQPCDAVVYDPTPEAPQGPEAMILDYEAFQSRFWYRLTVAKRKPNVAVLIECEHEAAGLAAALSAVLIYGLYARMINPRRVMCSTVPPGRWMLAGNVHSLPAAAALCVG